MPQLVEGYSLSASTNCRALRRVSATAVLSADTLKEAAEVMVYVSLPKVPFTFRDLPTY